MNLSHIPREQLEQIAQLTPQVAQAELQRQDQQAQALAEMEGYTSRATSLGTRLDQLIPEYEAQYQPLVQALATNPESKLIPELAALRRFDLSITALVWQYVEDSLIAGLLTDPLLTDLRGKPLKGRAAYFDFMGHSLDLGNSIKRTKVGDELERRTGRRELFSFPEPLSTLQVELINTAINLAQGKR